ncbi:RAB6A-GEF complex partner protein 2-like [Dreissena polymorpha]|uniref:RAB6A-GEF complex partner protein 2-like n=1 Tax=Dreissena polymorpha TaxID=45954 RepID=UPI002263D6BE|nr:RAB6A-GEF complex partner protein 2-like [Dreissena polymorpha]XP_052245822.1 RAB6A-GEF complex partner protein 2-like [Dreissena polymorpha]
MIEVNALLQRGTVFLAGETLQCNITFKNVGEASDSLSWASAQIHCQCSVSESRVFLPKALHLSSEDINTSADTSFVPSKGEHGMTVLSTKPRILFCDLKLEQGQSKTFTYTEVVPADSPPSFRGQAVKYSYKLTIGTQRINHPTKLLRIPFRILVLHGLNDLSVYLEPAEVQPANPFLLQKTEDTVLDIALHILETVTCRKGPHSYNITNSRGRVARCVMFKTAYKLGEDIIGIMDFSETNVSCVQFSVTLQSEETISEECRKKSAQGSSVTSYVRHQDTCLNTLKSHFSVPVPLTATPGFITDIVCQRWRLHFEFVTTVEPIQGEVRVDEDDSTTWRGPATLQVETMVWDFPVKIYPSHPGHASSVTLLKLLHSITV